MNDDALLAAFEAGDGMTIMRLYRERGEAALASGDEDAGCFYLTHAYVFALEQGADEAAEIRLELKKRGREA